MSVIPLSTLSGSRLGCTKEANVNPSWPWRLDRLAFARRPPARRHASPIDDISLVCYYSYRTRTSILHPVRQNMTCTPALNLSRITWSLPHTGSDYQFSSHKKRAHHDLTTRTGGVRVARARRASSRARGTRRPFASHTEYTPPVAKSCKWQQ